MTMLPLELARRLRDAGWPQDKGHWMYSHPVCLNEEPGYDHVFDAHNPKASIDESNSNLLKVHRYRAEECDCVDGYDLICCNESCDQDGGCSHRRRSAIAAPTVEELLEAFNSDEEMCPEGYDLRFWTYDRKLGKGMVCLVPFEEEDQSKWIYADNPASALALLWLALKEKKLV